MNIKKLIKEQQAAFNDPWKDAQTEKTVRAVALAVLGEVEKDVQARIEEWTARQGFPEDALGGVANRIATLKKEITEQKQ